MKKYIVLILFALSIGTFWFIYKRESIKNAPRCGGIAGEICPNDYKCIGMKNYPDASGYCVKI